MEALIPIDLTTGSRRDPLGIDSPRPLLGWALAGGGRNAVQTAWQIQVGCAPGVADHWDSGRVAGDAQLQIAYGGAPLASRTRYHWRVRVWDGAGDAGPWSDPAWFETAFLDPAGFAGAWIGLDRPTDDERRPLAAGRWLRPTAPHPHPLTAWCARWEIPAERTIRSAALHVYVDSHGIAPNRASWRFLCVNGNRLDACEHIPPSCVMTYDIRPWLRPGANTLALRTYARPDAAFIAAITIEFADGSTACHPTGASGAWRCRGVPDDVWGPAAGPVDWADAQAAGWEAAAEVGAFGSGPWPADDRRNRLDRLMPALELRRALRIDRPLARARIYATACGVYELAIDGRPVSDDTLAPGWTDYRHRVHYQTYDVTALLDGGAHELRATLGDGWWCGHLDAHYGCDWYGGAKALKLALHLDFADGGSAVIASDGSWQAGTGPIRLADLMEGQVIDRTRAISWRDAGILPGPAGRLMAQPDQPVRRLMELPVRALTSPRPGLVVLDFGQNLVGHLRLRLRAPRGTVITVRHAEVLDLAGLPWTDNLRSALATDRFVCSGGDDEFAPALTCHGFRYAEVSGLPAGLRPEQAVAAVVGSPTPDAGTFTCDDPLLNRLQANIRWGQRGNFLSIPTDCPQRDERMGWTADTQVFARTAIHNADCAAFYAKYVDDLLDAQHPSGAFPDYAPADSGPEKGRFGWADAGIIIPWTLWRCYGDTATLDRAWAGMRRYLAQRDAGAVDGLNTDDSYGDWVSPPPQTGNAILGPAYHAWMHRLMAEMALGSGRPAEAAHHQARFAAIRAAWRARHRGPDGRLGDDTQTAYACAVAAGVLDPEEAASHLARTVERHGWHLNTGFLGTACLLPALSRCGRDDIAWRVLMAEGQPGWLHTVRCGATTMWERWNTYDPATGPVNIGNMNSYNHYAFGAVGEWMYARIAGLDRAADDVGFQRLLIRPVPGGMCRHAAAEHRSPRGMVRVSWSIADGRIALQVEVPPNCRAEVHLPCADPSAALDHDGAERLPVAPGHARFAIGSGRWRFSAAS